MCHSEYRIELSRFHKKEMQMSLLPCKGQKLLLFFMGFHQRENLTTNKQTKKSPFSFPPSNIFVTKVMIAQYGLLVRFYYAFLPQVFHVHLLFPICSHIGTELSNWTIRSEAYAVFLLLQIDRSHLCFKSLSETQASAV